jgi:hypothetical protein
MGRLAARFGTTWKLPSECLTPAGIEAAKKAAVMILSCYPDYGKTSPQYIARITEAMATFPEWVLVEMCNLRTGIPATCEFLPTVAAIAKAGEEIMAAKEQDIEHRQQEAEAEAQRQWDADAAAERERLAAQKAGDLARAREKYKTAYLNRTLDLCWHSDIEGKAREILSAPDPVAWLRANKHTIPPRLVEVLSWHGVSLPESPEIDMTNQVAAIVANATASLK